MPKSQVPLKTVQPAHVQKILAAAQAVDDSVVALVIFRSTGRAVFVGGDDPVGAEGETHEEATLSQTANRLMTYPRGSRW